MMVEERLKGTIDQIENLVVFENGLFLFRYLFIPLAQETLTQWDNRIAAVCNYVNSTLELIQTKNPQLA